MPPALKLVRGLRHVWGRDMDIYQKLNDTERLPKFGVVKGIGKCKVLDYRGNGYFTLLDNKDHRRHVHRDRITFTNR